MVLPLAASTLWLAPISYNINGLIGDWNGLVSYGALLLYGAFLFGSSDVLAALNRQRWLSLGIGVAAYAALTVCFFDGAVRPVIAVADRPAYALLSAVNTMAWLFAIIGFANRHLTRRPAFLAEATEAVYPFYMLHQTVTVIAVYWLLQLGVPSVGRLHPGGAGDVPRHLGDLFCGRAPDLVCPPALRVEGGVQEQGPAILPLYSRSRHHAEFLERALTGEVVGARDRGDALEARRRRRRRRGPRGRIPARSPCLALRA